MRLKADSKILGLVMLAAILMSSCASYKHTSISQGDFYSNTKVRENISSYKIYVHEENRLWKLREAKIEEPGKLSGIITPLDNAADSSKAEISIEKLSYDERDDIHIILKEEIRLEQSDQAISIANDEVRQIKMAAKEDTGVFATTISALLLVLGIIVLLFLVLIGVLIIGLSSSDSTSNS